MSKALKYLLPLLLVFGAASCDVHEEPVGNTDIQLTVNLAFNYEIEPWRTVEFQTRATSGEDFSVRYVIRLYRYISDTFDKTPAYEFVSTGMDLTHLEQSFTFAVAPANYRIVAWTDYVRSGSEADLFYNPADFSEVDLTAEYTGNEERRAAWFGSDDLPLSLILYADASHEVTLPMERPHARYRFVATDKDAFINYWAAQLALRSGSAVKDTDALDINKFHVRYTYPQYLPTAFNLFTDRPVDARTGITFDAPMVLNADGTVDLGFDYVFVGLDEGSVVVSLSFYDENWEYISTVSNVEVPLHRSGLTTVTGKILTNGISSGISIDPTYDGEFNLIL